VEPLWKPGGNLVENNKALFREKLCCVDEDGNPEEPRCAKVFKKRLQPTAKVKPDAPTVPSIAGTELVPFQGAVTNKVMQDELCAPRCAALAAPREFY
jgi:hypothetical protein